VLLVDPEGLAGIVTTGIAWARTRLGSGPAEFRGGTRMAKRSSPRPKRHTPDAAAAAAEPAGLADLADLAEPTRVPGTDDGDAGVGASAARAGTRPADDRRFGSGEPGAALLEIRSVFKEYGGLSVLEDISLTLPERGLFALCGPNGAGKSTLLNVIGGSVPPSRGEVVLNGADITRRPPHERFYLGISRTFQSVHLIKGRTVLDNVAVACLTSNQSSITTRIARSRLDQARAQAARALADLGMEHLAGREVSSLTLESQRMVELARALAPSPRLLLLDEPASGLSQEQRQRLATVLTTLASRTCVFLVEHDLALVAQVSERIFVLSAGRVVFDGGPDDFRSSPVVTSLLVGS
jgi:ABC-type branched-subunit amino acid transport system ATPase component